MQITFKALFKGFVYGSLAIMVPIGILTMIGAFLQGASIGLMVAVPFMLVINVTVSGALVAAIILLGLAISERIDG